MTDSTGAGLLYRGPFIYRTAATGPNGTIVRSLESVPFEGGRLTAGGTLRYVTDHLGSIRAVVNDAGTPLAIDEYEPYGIWRAVPGSDGVTSASQTPAGVTFRYRFTGKEDLTPDLTLPYTDFGARLYSPALRRWLVPDKLSEKYYGINPYVYCHSNPVNYLDPDGLADKRWIIGGIGTLSKGVIETVAGIAAVSSGVGVGAGAFLISDGIATIGLGLGAVTIGLVSENSENQNDQLYGYLTSSPLEIFGKGMDAATETQTPYFELSANVIESAIGLSTFRKPNDVIDILSDVLTIMQTVETVKVAGEAYTINSNTLETSLLMTNTDTNTNTNTNTNNIEYWNKNLLESGLWDYLR